MKVSIVIPCYNAAAFLRQTLCSAVAQEVDGDVEILLWDDGSTDASVRIANEFEPRVRVLGDGQNRGGNVARNRLLEAASGDWLQYLDADDILLPGKIAGQLEAADAQAADLVYSPPQALPANDARWGNLEAAEPTHAEISGAAAMLVRADQAAQRDVWVDYIRWGVFQTSSMLFNRQALVEVGGWRDEQPRCQEHELLLRLLMADKKVSYDPLQRTLYRVHAGESVSRRNPAQTTQTRMELTDRAERHLREQGELTAARRAALAAARMESARSLVRSDPAAARRLARRVGRCGVRNAADSDALPKSYRLFAATFGFEVAERIAALSRRESPPATDG